MNDNSFLKELWKNPRIKAGLKLVIWLTGIFLVILISNLTSNNNQNSPSNTNNETKSLQTMQENLLKNNYEYYYDIITNNVTIKYHGKKSNNKEIGTKKSATTIKYYIENGQAYQVNHDELTEINDLFSIINQEFIDLEYIFNIVNNLKMTKSDNKYSCQTIINGKSYTIEIVTDQQNITSINLFTELESYQLTFLNHHNISINNYNDPL